MTIDPIGMDESPPDASRSQRNGNTRKAKALEVQTQAVVTHESPDGLRDYLLEITDGGRVWADRIVAGVRKDDRTCLRLFGEAIRAVGGAKDIADAIREAVGMPLAAARARLDMVAQYEGTDQATLLAECRRIVLEECVRDQEFARGMVKAIENRSRAEEVR